MTGVKDCKELLEKLTTKYQEEYNDIISSMQPYEVTTFDYELNSAFDHFSTLYFDEEKFKLIQKSCFDIDTDDPYVMEALFDVFKEYSIAFITISALNDYINDNDIMLGVEDERLCYC